MSANQGGCLTALLRLLGGGTEPAESVEPVKPGTAKKISYPYQAKRYIFSPAEFSFYKALQDATGNQAVVCPKVGIVDIIYVQKGLSKSERQSALNRIRGKHVDFLLCHPKSMSPMVALELDDSSHDQPDRRERDALVDNVFQAAGLPLLHIPVNMQGYSVEKLRALIIPYLNR